jgi:diketogulonate reductase-like aldo/keto reductase
LDDMKELLEGGEKGPEIEPAANQIELHLYNWHEQKANVEYCQAKVSSNDPLCAALTYLRFRASLSSLTRP